MSCSERNGIMNRAQGSPISKSTDFFASLVSWLIPTLYVFAVFRLQSADRTDVPNVIVLVTDSASSTSTVQTVATAKTLQLAGVKIFAIGSTSRVNVTELQLVASPPHLQYHQWWTISDFSGTSLNNIESDVESELCKANYGLFTFTWRHWKCIHSGIFSWILTKIFWVDCHLHRLSTQNPYYTFSRSSQLKWEDFFLLLRYWCAEVVKRQNVVACYNSPHCSWNVASYQHFSTAFVSRMFSNLLYLKFILIYVEIIDVIY